MIDMITSTEIQEDVVIKSRHVLPPRWSLPGTDTGYRNITQYTRTFIGLNMPKDAFEWCENAGKEVKVEVDEGGITIEFLDENRTKTIATLRKTYKELFLEAVK